MEKGRQFTVLGKGICRATAGDTVEFPGDYDTDPHSGCRIKSSCKDLAPGQLTVFNTEVKSFFYAPIREVNSPSLRKEYMGRVASQLSAQSLQREDWKVLEIQFKKRSIYTLTNDDNLIPLILIIKGKVVEPGQSSVIYRIERAFEINGKEYLDVRLCVDDTDNCGGEYLKGPDFKSHAFPE